MLKRKEVNHIFNSILTWELDIKSKYSERKQDSGDDQ